MHHTKLGKVQYVSLNFHLTTFCLLKATNFKHVNLHQVQESLNVYDPHSTGALYMDWMKPLKTEVTHNLILNKSITVLLSISFVRKKEVPGITGVIQEVQ